jgi:hypothetical protein
MAGSALARTKTDALASRERREILTTGKASHSSKIDSHFDQEMITDQHH